MQRIFVAFADRHDQRLDHRRRVSLLGSSFCSESVLMLICPGTQGVERVDAGAMTVIPDEPEAPAPVQFGVGDAKRLRARRRWPRCLGLVPHTATGCARAGQAQLHQVEVDGHAIEERDSYAVLASHLNICGREAVFRRT